MSLFLPSNLSPNFEEVFVTNLEANNSETVNFITFSFQVNTNGSQIRSYRIEILNEFNDEEDPDDNILYTEYGIFSMPLYNKDFGYIHLDLNRATEEGNNITLSDIIVSEKDYRWRVRLYEDEIITYQQIYENGQPNDWDVLYKECFVYDELQEGYVLNNDRQYNASQKYYERIIDINSVEGTTYIGSGNIVGTTKQVIWLNEYNDQIIEEDYVRTTLYSSDGTNDYNPFNTKKTGYDIQKCVAYPTFVEGQNYVNEFKIKRDNILPEYYDKLLDGNTYMSICDNQTQQSNDLQQEYNSNDQPIYIKSPDREQYLPKIIESLDRASDTGYSDWVILTLPERQAYSRNFVENNCLNDENKQKYCDFELVYIQRQQVYTIDKSIGNMQLSKLTLDEPFEYNTFHNTSIEYKLKNNTFDRDRLYINSVREFDKKLYSNAYINLAYCEEDLINTEREYFMLEEEPTDWKTSYNKYYELWYNPIHKKSRFEQVQPEYTIAINQGSPAPDNWSSIYSIYYIKKDDDTYSLNTNPTYDSTKNYYIMGLPKWAPYHYYKRISNIDIANHSHDMVRQIINYVSDTGECKLFSDLPFTPDQFYMYQIFVVDEYAPGYNPANTENPYKFFAGVGYNGETITGSYDGGYDDIFKINDQPCYLGGGYGNVIEGVEGTKFQSAYESTVFSNHQIGNTNQYYCFIQPNLAIKADEYKPCALQVYNNDIKKTLYITNYNNYQNQVVEFNKDYSIDTLDDSQWLVVLTYSDEDKQDRNILNEINNLVVVPQTKYKIYTNYVDSIPEGYFYCRTNKQLSFDYKDLSTMKSLGYYVNTKDDYKVINCLSQDILIECNICDENDLNQSNNYVPIKSYKYTISLLDETVADLNGNNFQKNENSITIIEDTDKMYDGKYQIKLRGINNFFKNQEVNDYSNLYRIQIEVEDELGSVHYLQEDVYFSNKIDTIYTEPKYIKVVPDYTSQTLNINISIPGDIQEDYWVSNLSVYKQDLNHNYKTHLIDMDDSDLYTTKNNQMSYVEHIPTITDYMVMSGNPYRYEVYLKIMNKDNLIDQDDPGYTYCLLTMTDYINPVWRTWSICDLDFYTTNNELAFNSSENLYEFRPSSKIFMIKNNLEAGEISDNINVISYNTLGQFGRLIQNQQRFDSGQITCMISDMGEYQKIKECRNITKINLNQIRKVLGKDENYNVGNYLDEYGQEHNKDNYLYIIDKDQSYYYVYYINKWIPVQTDYTLSSSKQCIDEWRHCVSNGKLKLLKAPTGCMWIVAISNTNSYRTEWKSAQYPTTISFNWQEVMDVNQKIVTKGE